MTDTPVVATGRIDSSFRFVTMAYAVEQLAHHLPASEYPSRLDIVMALVAGRILQTPGLTFKYQA